MFAYDFHTHILPGMDDGAADVSTAVAMIRKLQEQGVEHIVLTPHYYAENESVEEFLERREEAYARLMAAPEAESFPPLLLGAEVRLHRGMSERPELQKLCVQGTRLLLLEFPYLRHADWMLQEVENITYQLQVVPMLAHIDRFLTWGHMTEKQAQRVLDFEDAIVQINNEAVLERHSRKFVKKLLKEEYLFVFGSDTHNLKDRAPNFDAVADFLRKYDYEEPELFD
ncbi:MAG: capsular polysaccharide biosynthesis protein [Clostridia bacterium]|nr:capsular polysaccharide biosynthesis protein [Clostridia bacterium]